MSEQRHTGYQDGLCHCEPDSTDEEIIDVLLPVQDLRNENAKFARQHNQAIERMRIAEFRESELQADVERLRADLDRANEHNRNLMAEVNQQSKIVEAARNYCRGTAKKGTGYIALDEALRELDKPTTHPLILDTAAPGWPDVDSEAQQP